MNRDDKILALRKKMKEANIKAVIIPSPDPHGSEYVHDHWKIRGWFSDFNGSAGTLVITDTKAGLWTDFRYYIAADQVLKGSEIVLYKDGLPKTPSIKDFILENLKDGDSVGIDGTLFSTTQYLDYKTSLDKKNIAIIRDFDPADGIWMDRPAQPKEKAYDFSDKYCGESRESKLSRVRSVMEEKNVDTYLISSLDSIAWLLNIRGGDVAYNPVVISYLVVTKSDATLFIDSDKVDNKLKDLLKKDNVKLGEYNDIGDYITKLPKSSSVYYMAESLNCYLSGLVDESIKVVTGSDITTDFKAIKNKTEIENTRVAMEKDGAALVKFFSKIPEIIKDGNATEYSVESFLRECRLSMADCVDESFAPIIGYESNAALCHYSAEEDSAKTIKASGMLLVDSGGQYLQGTTDITRTLAMGTPTVEEIFHYTLVLKGHVKLSMAKFPEGTLGSALDILAREPLWNHGLNFGHGTGHGVGFFLGVHEGPQSISPRSIKVTLKDGMITSNEPGLYLEGRHGIRIENLVLSKYIDDQKDGEFGKFMEFETLTLFPYDLSLIDTDLLTADEIQWINNYHKEVRSRISKYLDSESELKWLEDSTREI